jgi:hypothetical protein
LSYKVKLRDYNEDILPFCFQGFWNEGYCFMRIKIEKGKALFFCTQLPNYTGTSVTNAIESVFQSAINHLIENDLIDIAEDTSFIEKLFSNKTALSQKKYNAVVDHIYKNALLIEHYPPGVGLAENGSYAKVNFGASGEPAWNYTSKERLLQKVGDEEIFKLNYEELLKWQEPKHC